MFFFVNIGCENKVKIGKVVRFIFKNKCLFIFFFYDDVIDFIIILLNLF